MLEELGVVVLPRRLVLREVAGETCFVLDFDCLPEGAGVRVLDADAVISWPGRCKIRVERVGVPLF